MRAIIIEDEPLSVAELRTTLAEIAPQIEVVATASSVAEAAAVIAGVGHDLIFMDIHLGDGSGFDIFERTEITVPVIFITAYDSYALKAFENKGIDYLLKPFGREDLQRAIDKLGLLSGGGSASAEHGAPTQTPPVYQERFLVHMGARMKSVTTAEIAYFMADGKYLHLVTHDGKDYIVDRTLTEVGEKLPPNLFFRINRRFIVAFDAIREMIRYSGSRIKVVLHPPLTEGEEAFVSTDRVPDFRQWLNRKCSGPYDHRLSENGFFGISLRFLILGERISGIVKTGRMDRTQVHSIRPVRGIYGKAAYKSKRKIVRIVGRNRRSCRLGLRSRCRTRCLLLVTALLPVGSALRLCAVGGSRSTVRSGIVRAAAQQVHRVGQNFGRIAFVVVLVHPFAGAQAPLDIDLRTFADKTVHHVGKTAPQGDRMPLGVFLRLVRRPVEQTLRRRQTDTGDLHAAFGRTHLGVDAHVADQYDFVYHLLTGF